ncbi:MAG: hypothetical protein ABI193_15660 [Minicystis sp.]
MSSRRLAALVGLLAFALAAADCSATRANPTGAGGGGAGSAGSTTTSSGQGGAGGIGVETDGGLPTGLRFTGTVWGPHADGKSPLFAVPGALVLASKDPPDAIPACNACVKLPVGAQYALSGADGSFQLDVTPGTSFYLVVEKGQFRRVSQVSAPDATGIQVLGEIYTTLPNHTDLPNGDAVPRLALVYGDYDHIEDVLSKVGIGGEDGAFGHQWGTESGFFDVYDNSGPSEPKHGQSLSALLHDPQKLAGYDVILFSCSYNANFAFMKDAVVQQNLRDFVWNGGKLYVSDYAMPVVEMAWNEFVWFTDPVHGGCTENQFPPNCNHGPPFDSPATSPDPGLSAWLKAMGSLDGLVIKENWDTIGGLAPSKVGVDPVTMTPLLEKPKVWVEGPWAYSTQDLMDLGIDPATWDKSAHPLTVAFPYNCGRVLFTTYHTVGGTIGGKHPGLLPQEMILFYLLMELTVCQEGPIVK